MNLKILLETRIMTIKNKKNQTFFLFNIIKTKIKI